MANQTEAELNLAIEEKLAAYREAVETQPARVAAAHLDGVKELRQQLSDLLSAGAVPRVEGLAVIGMLKCPAYPISGGRTVSAVYEVGDGEYRSRGSTPEAAVAAWNRGEYVKAGG